MKKYLVAALVALAPLCALSQILIGQTAGFSGPVAAGVKETTSGAKLWIDAVNARGGVNGQKIELISLDDKFEPPLAAANARTLIEERNVLALFLNRGTPHTEAILPLLEANGVALVAPSTGAMVLHQPVKKQVFNVRATYQREAEKAVTHLRTLGIERIAVVHADDSFGSDGVEGANKGFAKAGFQPVTVIKADRAKPDLATIVPAIVAANAQAVVWIASGNSVSDGVKALR
jgi:ABC-type branched-subunit amino acid transport system substrate-binding protein